VENTELAEIQIGPQAMETPFPPFGYDVPKLREALDCALPKKWEDSCPYLHKISLLVSTNVPAWILYR
jgi:hypothetical protein